MKPKIIWELYKSPFATDMSDSEWDYILEQKQNLEIIKRDDENEYSFYEVQQNNKDQLDMFKDQVRSQKRIPVIATGLGFVPIVAHADITKTRKIYNVHTNFDISSDIIGLICRTPGVEIFDAVSRYSCRVGIGVCFDIDIARKAINTQLIEYCQTYLQYDK